ncbi:MAG: hypothetical protein ABH829_01200 [archaeon]
MGGAYRLVVSLFDQNSLHKLKGIIDKNMPTPEKEDDPVMNMTMQMEKTHSIAFILDVNPKNDASEGKLGKVTRTIVESAKDEKVHFRCKPEPPKA